MKIYIFQLLAIRSLFQNLLSGLVYFEQNSNQNAGEISNYIFEMTPSTDLPADIDFRITMPEMLYDVSDYLMAQCDNIPNDKQQILQGNLFCFTSKLSTQIKLRLKDVQNPKKSLITDLFKYDILRSQTNTTIELAHNVIGLKILPGIITQVSLKSYYSLYDQFSGFQRQYILSFKPTNAFQSSMIVTDFESVENCQIIGGLFDKSLNEDSLCTAFANNIYLTNFQQYTRSRFSNEYIQVYFVAKIKPYAFQENELLFTEPISITTYQTENFLQIVDQDSVSVSTQIQIIKPRIYIYIPMNNNISLTNNNMNIVSQNTIVFTLTFTLIDLNPAISSSYQNTGKIIFEIPNDYSGVPICTFTKFGQTPNTKIYPCYLTYSQIIIDVNDISYAFQMGGTEINPSTLAIKGLINPQIPNDYLIRAIMYFNNNQGNQYLYYLDFIHKVTPVIINVNYGILSTQINVPNILIVSFNYLNALSSGIKTVDDPFVTFSFIDVLIDKVIDEKLGYNFSDKGIIDCIPISGLKNAIGYNFQCSVFNSGTAYTIIRVQNYDELPKSDTPRTLSFGIPLIYTSTINQIPKAQIFMYISEKKITRKITQSADFVQIATSTSYSLVPAASIIAAYTGSIVLQSEIEVSFTINISNSIAAGAQNGIYFSLPLGFSFADNPEIKLGTNLMELNKKAFIFNSMQSIFINPGIIINTGNLKISINKVKTPDFQRMNFRSTLYTSKSNVYLQEIPINFDNPSIGIIQDLKLILDNDKQGFKWAKYTFQFKITMKFVNIIDFSFPNPVYKLSDYSGIIECMNFVNLIDFDQDNKIQCTVNNNVVIIDKFKIQDYTEYVSLTITAITNPSSNQNIMVTFRNQIGLNSAFAIQQSNIQAIIGGVAPSLNLSFENINSLPSNKGKAGIYLFEVKTSNIIPKYSAVKITFPNEFPQNDLYQGNVQDVYCAARLGLFFLKSCNLNPLTRVLSLETYEDSILNMNVILEYYGLVQNSVNRVGNFQIKIYYKGNTATDVIYSNSNNKSTTIEANTVNMQSSLMNFYPQNEGERASYEFTLKFTSAINQVLKGQFLFISFPSNYDVNLGPYKLIVTSKDLDGALYYILYRRVLKIGGFYSKNLINNEIKLKIFGIVNPNRKISTSLQNEVFQTGLLDIDGYKLIQASNSIKNIVSFLAPENINLISLKSSTEYSRQQISSYSFVIEPEQSVLDNTYGGQLYIDFPQDFTVDYYDGKCTINQKFSFFANCKMEDENLRFFIQTNNKEWQSHKDGYITATIQNVRSPDIQGQTKDFIVYNYDSLNKIILGRTYNNLKIACITTTYEGKLIDVNNNLPYDLEVGSFSDSIIINFNIPEDPNHKAKTTLTLTPNVLDSSILIRPTPVVIKYKQQKVTFKIAAPRTILLKSFFITWSKTGDTYPPTYADLKMTEIRMVKGTLKRHVRLEKMEYIRRDGQSYPLMVRIPNPPYQELIVKVSLIQNIFDGTTLFNENLSASLNVAKVSFDKDQEHQSYTVYFKQQLSDPNVKVYHLLDGFDKDSFELFVYNVDDEDDPTLDKLYKDENNCIEIRNDPADYTPPQFLDQNPEISQITRSSVKLTIKGSQKGFLFFIIANQRIPIPTFLDVKNQKFNYTLSFSNPLFGINYIRRTDKKATFLIYDLKPDIDYEIYMFIMNMNNIENKTYKKIAFRTLAPQQIAQFTLKLFQQAILYEVKKEYIAKMAEMVSIEKARIIERETKCKDANLDVSDDLNILYWNLLLLPDPINEDPELTPIRIVELLNTRRTEIRTFIPRLDTEQFITMKNMSQNIPSFVQQPKMLNRTISQVSIQFSLTECGSVYVIGIPKIGSENSTIISESKVILNDLPNSIYPTSFQIIQKLNQNNLPVQIQGSSYVDKKGKYFNLTFDGLKDRLVYDFYVTAQNDFPSLNVNMPDQQVTRCTIKTIKKKCNQYNFIYYFFGFFFLFQIFFLKIFYFFILFLEPLNIYSIKNKGNLIVSYVYLVFQIYFLFL
ncbi:hypothetical protein IMG5_168390 [Ichthyophthirius multifiliis]|uniref:Transmembrane protein n=1 Tax=Ichthyophthirius multifiliis TaxID=5932 RepID=G0R136_ICHMU|nr:hypothetical protein IMG5_168390 [Ichthyophthirius multifiliis]EGR28803.1 hypothetical protein IMG5_168390 [Ichthyophthirius multifiliis]|eukprot:XP_004030039.1 hypothetical protein IMG5_168390 [Ichthyophthirius multifiliis]